MKRVPESVLRCLRDLQARVLHAFAFRRYYRARLIEAVERGAKLNNISGYH